MAQVVQHPPRKHEALNSNPRTMKKKEEEEEERRKE
jgi:hypothetical protein